MTSKKPVKKLLKNGKDKPPDDEKPKVARVPLKKFRMPSKLTFDPYIYAEDIIDLLLQRTAETCHQLYMDRKVEPFGIRGALFAACDMMPLYINPCDRNKFNFIDDPIEDHMEPVAPPMDTYAKEKQDRNTIMFEKRLCKLHANLIEPNI